MSMVWVVILASIAGVGEHHARPIRATVRPAICASIRADQPAPCRLPKLARRVAHRPCSCPLSSPGVEEFDTENVDESWVVALDALASVPVAMLDWARPGSSPEPVLIEISAFPSVSTIPLRC